jgi:outer membrane protein assembly factor BamB
MKNHHGDMVIVDGYLYGSNDPGILTCLELETGDVKWQTRDVGKGAVTYAEGRIYVRVENGKMFLVAANPERFQKLGEFDQESRSTANAWPHPVVAAGSLFLRDQDVLLCYDLRAQDDAASAAADSTSSDGGLE